MPKQTKTETKSDSKTESKKVAEVAAAAAAAAKEQIQKSATKAPKKEKASKEKSTVPESVPESLVESVVDESAAVTSVAEASSSATEGTRKRRQVTREDVDKAFDDLVRQIDEEVEALRSDKAKGKGVRFLRSVAKQVRQLKSDSLRLSTKRARRQASGPRSTNSGFMKPVKISKDMQKFTGIKEDQLVSRVDVTKSICEYVKKNNLQNEKDRRQFTPDEKLSKLLGTSESLTYYNLQKHIQHHFVKA